MDCGQLEKGSSAWTEDAKFLLRIVAQLKGDGRGIKWEKINIPGRTVKSLQNMWTKINKQINDFEARENSGEGSLVIPAKPRKRGPPRKKALAGAAGPGDEDLDDDFSDVKQKFVKKRTVEDIEGVHIGEGEHPGRAKKRPKVKAEATAGPVRVKREDKFGV
ncbi:hypothetical protein M431DRAFT_12616 [Trichoderma harzianum CBS 226.95]|uniref:Myb-like domain-containing protein n=1 Tax=Trichoderma harzianum CBS 226.95 TaxID=983964 RepID=A0A2T4AUM2_TRIHA|nr:hypothetical protein M431DRAFT_12616 [Trichoderma harzianum CBS 226.95]PTB60766.1 hypothetical protein M431DRAFT_12616 [Trichoderma harzianum CBS 226.95]